MVFETRKQSMAWMEDGLQISLKRCEFSMEDKIAVETAPSTITKQKLQCNMYPVFLKFSVKGIMGLLLPPNPLPTKTKTKTNSPHVEGRRNGHCACALEFTRLGW